MKVVAFVGSPRKEGNTAILVKEVLEGARSRGAEVETVHVYDLKMSGCIHCGACKGKRETCALNDDMTPLYDAIQEADAVLIASPVYMGRITGPLKSFFDRWYAFFDKDFKTRLRPGKKIVAASVYAAPKGTFDGEDEYIIDWCTRWGMTAAGRLCVPEVAQPGDIRSKEGVLEEARRIGESLVA